MSITLDQARALDALDRGGTFERAAAALHKGHTAVLYALRTMEEQLGLTLLDRRGYRTKLTPEGQRVLEHARKLLDAERALEDACTEIKQGWEPRLRLVFDGIFPTHPILRVVEEMARAGAKTRIDVSTGFLAGVEETFRQEDAELMISVLPPAAADLRAVRLAPIRAVLVAHRGHPLVAGDRELTAEQLAAHMLITVRGSDPRLQLSTAGIEPPIAVRLNDFQAKKAAILSGLGFGWMPEYLVAAELRRGVLRRVRWRAASVHVFEPRLYHRTGARLGRAAQLVVQRLREDAKR